MVSGGVTVAVALGAGAAIAQPGKNLPTLQDVAESSIGEVTTTTIAPDQDGVLALELTASPLSELSEPSEPSEESEPSEPSEESEPSISPESPDSDD